MTHTGPQIQAGGIDCRTCNTAKSMIPTKMARMSGVVVVIGWILLLPSFLGFFMAVTCVMATGSAATDVAATAGSDAEMAGAAVGTAMGLGMAAFLGISSLVGGLLGWILIMKKKVFRCMNCGFILDRS